LKEFAEWKFGTPDFDKLDKYVRKRDRSVILKDLLGYYRFLMEPKTKRMGKSRNHTSYPKQHGADI